jgi:hypothetical protein
MSIVRVEPRVAVVVGVAAFCAAFVGIPAVTG